MQIYADSLVFARELDEQLGTWKKQKWKIRDKKTEKYKYE